MGLDEPWDPWPEGYSASPGPSPAPPAPAGPAWLWEGVAARGPTARSEPAGVPTPQPFSKAEPKVAEWLSPCFI